MLEDIEHVLHTPCPAPITATLAAGVWGDDEHPCGDEDPRKGTTAPQRTVNQRNADIAAHKKADKRLKALVIIKASGDLKKHASHIWLPGWLP